MVIFVTRAVFRASMLSRTEAYAAILAPSCATWAAASARAVADSRVARIVSVMLPASRSVRPTTSSIVFTFMASSFPFHG